MGAALDAGFGLCVAGAGAAGSGASWLARAEVVAGGTGAAVRAGVAAAHAVRLHIASGSRNPRAVTNEAYGDRAGERERHCSD